MSTVTARRACLCPEPRAFPLTPLGGSAVVALKAPLSVYDVEGWSFTSIASGITMALMSTWGMMGAARDKVGYGE